MKSLSLPFLAVIVLLASGFIASAQDADDGKKDLDLFSDSAWHINLGTEFPGAQGTFTIADEDGAKIGKIDYDFSGGGLYVAGVDSVNINEGVSEFRIKVKSETPQKIVIRIFDSTKQCHQYPSSYATAGEWQVMRVDLKAKSSLSFGGAKDHVIHFPITQIWLGVEKMSDQPKGEVLFKDGVTFK